MGDLNLGGWRPGYLIEKRKLFGRHAFSGWGGSPPDGSPPDGSPRGETFDMLPPQLIALSGPVRLLPNVSGLYSPGLRRRLYDELFW